MQKILIANDLVFGGGVENIMLNLVTYLKGKDYDITVFTPFYDNGFYKVYSNDVKYLYLYKYSVLRSNTLFARIIKKLIRILKFRYVFKQYDIAVAIKEGDPVFHILNSIRATRKISWIHTDYATFHWTKGYFQNNEEERNLISQFDKTICVTNAVKENLISTIGDPENLVVRYNPINTDEIILKSQKHCPLKRDDNKLLFVSVGRLSKEKGYVELLETISRLENKDAFELWIIGGGNAEYSDALKNTIEEKNMENSVKLLGNIENPFPYLKQADLFICSSLSESFGLAVQEALVLGVPVITTNCPGVLELVNSSVSIAVNNMEEMRKNLSEIINDTTILEKYKISASEFYSSDSYEQRLEAIEDVFNM